MLLICVSSVLLNISSSIVHVVLHLIYSVVYFSIISLSQHGYYSRTVVIRLLERKYKSLVSDSLVINISH